MKVFPQLQYREEPYTEHHCKRSKCIEEEVGISEEISSQMLGHIG